nr:MAG TPA: hypothetical protein [Caudoviricetes sp.]
MDNKKTVRDSIRLSFILKVYKHEKKHLDFSRCF